MRLEVIVPCNLQRPGKHSVKMRQPRHFVQKDNRTLVITNLL